MVWFDFNGGRAMVSNEPSQTAKASWFDIFCVKYIQIELRLLLVLYAILGNPSTSLSQ